MKGFFKSLFASILGFFISVGILVVVLVVIIFAFSLKSTDKYILEDNTIFTLNLNGILSDRVDPNPLLEIFDKETANQLALEDILNAIQTAKNNDNVKGIYINAGVFSASSASLKEIRDKLTDFKTTGKFVVSYADTYTQGCYYLSSVSDKVILNPQGNLDLHGYSAGPTFYKGLLEKLGVEIQIFKVGTYKSAVEPFMLDKMSDASKEQVTAYISDMWNTTLSDISASREIPVEKLNLIADSLPLLREQERLITNNLVDTLMYETDVKKYLKTLVNAGEKDKLRLASVKDMLDNQERSDVVADAFFSKSNSKDVIAILYAEGSITDGSSKDGITGKRYVKEIEKLKNDDNVKAVVFRVNSGGGSAYASEQIWKAISDLKDKKPVVVSMGDYAASGGYYISCNASKIIAQPNTLTGSIGIFGMFPNMEGLTKKVGLTFDNVKTNKHADFGDLTRPMREDEKVILQGYIDRGYDLFLTRCSEGRGIPKDSLNLIAQGRVWTGNMALALGLVDGLGGIDTAIEEAVKLSGVVGYSVNSYPTKTDFWESLLMNQKEELSTRLMKEYLGGDYQSFKIIKEIKEQDFMQARLPYDFSIE